MSEKRFHKDMLNIVDVLTNKAYTFEFEEDSDEMLDLLNSLNDELEDSSAFIIEQRKENKTLKEENEHLEEYCGDLEADVKRLMKENEQLRQRNRKLYKCALYGKTIGD